MLYLEEVHICIYVWFLRCNIGYDFHIFLCLILKQNLFFLIRSVRANAEFAITVFFY